MMFHIRALPPIIPSKPYFANFGWVFLPCYVRHKHRPDAPFHAPDELGSLLLTLECGYIIHQCPINICKDISFDMFSPQVPFTIIP